MVNIQLLCVGKLKEKHFSAACAEYQKRLGAFCKLTVTELPEVRLPEHPTPTQVEGALAREWGGPSGQAPQKHQGHRPVRGGSPAVQPLPWPPSWSSGWWKGPPHLTLIIGGSFGLHPQ